MTTISELVCQARGITPVLGTLRGICIYCQRETEHGHKQLQWSHGRLTVVTEGATVLRAHAHRFNGATVV